MAQEAQLVQQLLNEAGFNAGTVDGRFGPETREALEAFRAGAASLDAAQVSAIQAALQAVADSGTVTRRDNVDAINTSLAAAVALSAPAQEAAAAATAPAAAPAAEAPAAAPAAEAPAAAPAAEAPAAAPAAEAPAAAPAAEAPAAEAPAAEAPAAAPAAEAPAQAAAGPETTTAPSYTLVAPSAEGYDTVWKVAEAWRDANPEAFAEGGEFAGIEGGNNQIQAVTNRIHELNDLDVRYICDVNGQPIYGSFHEGTPRSVQPGDALQLPQGNGFEGVEQVNVECDKCEPPASGVPGVTPGGTPGSNPNPQPDSNLCTDLPSGGLHVAIDGDRNGRTDYSANVDRRAFNALVNEGEAYPGTVPRVGTSLPYGYCAPIGREDGGRDPEPQPEPEPEPQPAPGCDGSCPQDPTDPGKQPEAEGAGFSSLSLPQGLPVLGAPVDVASNAVPVAPAVPVTQAAESRQV